MSSTFLSDVSQNPANAAILACWEELALPNAWLVAGCLFQTVRNLQSGRHLRYQRHFGRPYPELCSSEDGIRRFLALETCVGVRPKECHAPHGLEGIYAGTLSPNPLTPYPELFAKKVESYCARWPHLVKGVMAANMAVDVVSPG
jgi:hypothetical protein